MRFRFPVTTAVFAFLTIASQLFAQTPTPTPPRPPYIIQSPPGTQWSVRIEQPSTSAAPPALGSENISRPPAPSALSMKVGTNGVQEGTVTMSDGGVLRFYALNGSLFQKTPAGKVIRLAPGEMDPHYIDGLWVTGFPAVAWLADANFLGMEEVEKKTCHVFQAEVTETPESEPRQMKAWVETATRHPVRVQIGDRTFLFSPVAPFTQPIEFPRDYAAAAALIQKQNNALERITKSNFLSPGTGRSREK